VLGSVGGLKGVFRVRYGSSVAKKWTSVRPCPRWTSARWHARPWRWCPGTRGKQGPLARPIGRFRYIAWVK